MAKVNKKSLSDKSTTVSKNLRKTKKIPKTKSEKGVLSKRYRKITKIFTDKKTGKQHIKYFTDNKAAVYIEHIPHGFYEEQIKDFFKQFGDVTAVNVPRSKNGNSKGYGFVQFQHPEVAKIAAETMNNYLMFNRLIKTKYIPPEQQKSYLFRKAETAILKEKTAKDLAQMRRKQDIKQKSKYLDSNGEKQFQTKVKRKLNAWKKRCVDLGVEFNCQITGGSSEEVVQLLSTKQLSESPQPVQENKTRRKRSAESVPAKVERQKKISKSPKQDKKTVQKSLKANNAELVPPKIKTEKKICKSSTNDKKTKTAQKSLKAANKEIVTAKVKMLKASDEIPKRAVRVKKSVTKCLKKIDKGIPSVIKKKINERTKLVKKKLPKKVCKKV